jgi:succinate-semialdehyde dehydrogenase/glutarate-semialdehyde dehydrogenase
MNVLLFIEGQWVPGAKGRTLPIVDPATDAEIGTVAHAERSDLDRAVAAADRAFASWKLVSAYDRCTILRKAAAIFRERGEDIAELLTQEQGKPLFEARLEVARGVDIIEWFAEEARRAYGRVIPARAPGVLQMVVKEPVGPVAAFTPWNFPINQTVRKVAAALAAGCSVVVKGPEETPAACAELIRAFADGGVPAGAVNLVYGVPAEISEYLVPHPVIRKISFTGSTSVGKQLAALAGQHMKRVTMELGGHAPAIVFDDADIDTAVRLLGNFKYWNAGQVCGSPTRFLVQEKVYDAFVDKFTTHAKNIKVGNGLEEGTKMGPLANRRRVQAVEGYIADAVQRGAKVATGGRRIGNTGNFFEPTVLTDVPTEARVMNEEPFGPIAIMRRFSDFPDAMSEANRLLYGLASYAYTSSAKTAQAVAATMEAGMVSINHQGVGLPETPFGGIKDSGYGSEGGTEAMDAYLNSKFVTQAGI